VDASLEQGRGLHEEYFEVESVIFPGDLDHCLICVSVWPFMCCLFIATQRQGGLLWPCRESNLDAAVSRRDRSLYKVVKVIRLIGTFFTKVVWMYSIALKNCSRKVSNKNGTSRNFQYL